MLDLISVPPVRRHVRPDRDDMVDVFHGDLWELARNFGMKIAASTRVPRVRRRIPYRYRRYIRIPLKFGHMVRKGLAARKKEHAS